MTLRYLPEPYASIRLILPFPSWIGKTISEASWDFPIDYILAFERTWIPVIPSPWCKRIDITEISSSNHTVSIGISNFP